MFVSRREVYRSSLNKADLSKRLQRGQFKLHMDPSTMAVEIDATQLAMLLDGIDFGRVRRPEYWQPPSQVDRPTGRPMDKPSPA